MPSQVLLFPVLPDKSADDAASIARYFRAHPAEYAESRARLGVTLERAYLQETPMGSIVAVYMESDRGFDTNAADVLASDLAIDKFFVDSVREIHGIDMTEPPPAGPAPEAFVWADPEVSERRRGMAFGIPLNPGADDEARAFLGEVFARFDDLAQLRRPLGTNLEVVTLIPGPQGSYAGAYVESRDPFAANAAFAASQTEFDLWFKSELGKLLPPFIDLSQPVGGISELFDSTTLPAA